MLPEQKKAFELLESLPKEKLYSAIDFLEFLNERETVKISDTGRQVIIGPEKSSNAVVNY